MSLFFTLLLSIGIPVSYLMFIGYIGPKIFHFCYDAKGLDFRYHDNAVFMTVLTCIFLPILLPVMIGLYLSRQKPTSRETKIVRRHNRAIAEAEHKKQLAIIEAETTLIKEREVGIK